MSITNLSLFVSESEIDPAVARDSEYQLADTNHQKDPNAHSGVPQQVRASTAPTANLAGNSLVLCWNAIHLNQGTAEFINYSGLGGGDAFGFYRFPGNSISAPTTSNRVARIDLNGGYIQVSDRRVKSHFEPCPGLDIILALLPQKYRHWECLGCGNHEHEEKIELGENYKNKIGFIAQEVQKILPEAVPTTTSTEELLGLDISQIVAVTVRATQELHEKITALEQQVQALQEVNFKK